MSSMLYNPKIGIMLIGDQCLKGPKFVAEIFTQIRPVWIGELETRSKTSKN